VTLIFENRSQEERQFHYRLWGPVDLVSEAIRGEGTDLHLLYGESGMGGEVRVQVMEISSIKQPEWVSANQDRIVFIGASNNYFAALLAAADPQSTLLDRGFAEIVPDQHRSRQLALEQFGRDWDGLDANQKKTIEEKVYKFARTGLQSRQLTLGPGKSLSQSFLIFLGPRDENVLAAYPQYRLTEINYYGWWTPLVKVFLQVLKGFHFVLFKSWGLAIMGLTLLVRLCLHPLNRRQQASMMRYQKKMNAVKPQMDAIKERFGTDRMRMNQEMQKLFKEEGINPAQMMGGCLMIFLQMPVWFALYRTIEVSLDLRRAPFLWIEDLTQPDRLMDLPFAIPFLGWHAINVLPVIYVILTILQQKMQPKPSDPQMQQQMKMMTYMMVFFGFIFYSFPAGFLLYFITSAAIGMLESKIIKRMLAREGLGPAAGGALAQVPSAPKPSALYPARGQRDPKRKR
jgi:YidC/Oxa1 family membrane protein insertase